MIINLRNIFNNVKKYFLFKLVFKYKIKFYKYFNKCFL